MNSIKFVPPHPVGLLARWLPIVLGLLVATPARADVTRFGEVLIVEGDAQTATALDGGGYGLSLDNVRTIVRKAIGFAGDHFEGVTLWTAFEDQGTNALAYAVGVKNDVSGIGQALMDGSADYGSRGVLRNIVNMKSIGLRTGESRAAWSGALETWGQEAGHRWLAFLLVRDPRTGQPSDALLGRDCAHWHRLVDTQASVFDGYTWLDNGNGTFTWTETTIRYGDLDLYAMGLLDADDVRPFFFIDDVPGYTRPTCDNYGRVPPPAARTIKGTRVDVTMDDLLAVNGRRVYGGTTPEDYVREAQVVVTAPGDPASGAVPQALARRIDQARVWWQDWVREASGRRLAVCTQTAADCGDARADVVAVRPIGDDPAARARSASLFDVEIANRGTRTATDVVISLEAVIGAQVIKTSAPTAVGALPPGQAATARLSLDLSALPCASEAVVKAVSGSADHTVVRRLAVLVGTETRVSDGFEDVTGWTIDPDGDDSSRGARWERGKPESNELLGVVVQPGGAHQGQSAWATGLGGGGEAQSYVRGGKATLQSPPFGAAGLKDPVLRYWVNFAGVRGSGLGKSLETSSGSRLVVQARTLTGGAADAGGVDAPADGGTVAQVGDWQAGDWIELERLQGEITGGWVQRSVAFPPGLDLTGRVQLRFVAADDNVLQGAVEAAIDDVEIASKLPVCFVDPPRAADAGADGGVPLAAKGSGCGCRVGDQSPAGSGAAGLVALAMGAGLVRRRRPRRARD